MKILTLADIPDVPLHVDPSELAALLKELPDFPLEPNINEEHLREALLKSSTLNALLENIYPSPANVAFAAGALAKRNVEPGKYLVGESKITRNSTPPGYGHVGVVGDLIVQGDLDVVANLVVTGDLIVQGTIEDCGPDSRIAVHGNLICDHLLTSGWILVGGDVRVKGFLYGEYNDDALEVLGDIEAGIILTRDHSIDPVGEFRVKHAPRAKSVWGKQPLFDIFGNEAHIAELRALLGPEILDDENDLDFQVARRAQL